MVTTIQINERGSLTLPKALRKTLGLERGGVVMAEAREGGILIRPAMAVPIEMYDEQRIQEFDQAEQELARHLQRKAGGK